VSERIAWQGFDTDLMGEIDRRQFFRLMGASLALAGLGACTRQPPEEIVPYVRQPEHLVLGRPLYFATAMPLFGYGTGLLVESHEFRPTKVEGNPEHPASLGATSAVMQASVLGLYDPDRSQVITSAGAIRPWSAFLDAARAAAEGARVRRGAGLRLLTGTVTSPTLAAQIAALLHDFPDARWHQYEPAVGDGARLGSRRAFGQDVATRYAVGDAAVILALDADFLASGPASLRYAREFVRARRLGEGRREMSRLYVVEPTPSVTGSVADHRLPLAAGDVEALARAVAAALGLRVRTVDAPAVATHRRWIEAVARDLERHRGAALVVAGEQQPAAVHALAHAMNDALGNVGRTVVHTQPVEARPVDQSASLHELVTDMAAGQVECLVVLGGNPVFTAPVDLDFASALERVGLRIHLGLHHDETARLCHWHVPEAHYLEAWSDARAHDGTATIIQPLIAPLYQGRTAHELLAVFSEEPARTSYEVVREHWQRERSGGDFEAFWRQALHEGIVPDTALPPRTVALRADWDAAPAAPPAAAGGLELVLRPDPYLLDGRFANNGWLQELPRPITKLTWDNAALIAPATAERLGVASGDMVELRYRERTLRAPAWVVPGQAADAVTLHLGFGRTRAGSVGDGIGVDAYTLRTADAPHFGRGLELRPTGEQRRLACTQEHQRMEGRAPVHVGTLAAWQADPHLGHEAEPLPSLYPPVRYEGHAWGMAIDLGACIGCNACVAACQAENNIPVVGRDQVARGRELHWLRVDAYVEGDAAAPTILHQPVPCMHCENAPCEVVCPVNATVHSSEGLNDMVYNRCVGTRYCSNNCPYKVRRFNFYLYADWTHETLKMARNPDVTVRSRGVMEKCTYCVQRIEEGRIRARSEGRSLRDGEIVTACQQACPAEAIVFGDVNDPTSRVARLKADPRNYALLAELNTRPRTTYLARVLNPNPALEDPPAGGHA
jgi:molybdopterin-containing oxidoreductase family iron-sulfur binding subunit